jgi:hypothetical protein
MRSVYLDSTRPVLISVLTAFVISFSACGGGGGGGGGGGNDQYSSATGVRVLHAAIDATPVDVFVDGVPEAVAKKAVFGLNNGYNALPSGLLNLTMTRTSTPSVVVDKAQVAVDSDSRVSILLYGDNATFGLRATVLTDGAPEDRSNARVRIVDGVTAAAEIVGTVSSGVEERSVNVKFGEASDYLAVPPGVATLQVVRAADGRFVASTTATLEAGKEYTYLVAGEVQFFVKGLLLTDR